MAYDALVAGRFEDAKKDYTHAIEVLRLAGDWRTELSALTGLGRACYDLGDFQRSRECHLQVVKLSGQRNDFYDQGHAFNNLGALEFIVGDPGAAVDYYRRSQEAFRLAGNTTEWITPAVNAAIARNHMGEYAAAAATLDGVIAACDSAGSMDLAAFALSQLATTRSLQGRHREAADACRQGLAPGRVLSPPSRANLLLALCAALLNQDSAAVALAMLDGEARALRGRVPELMAIRLDQQRGELQLALGRPREALESLRRADRPRSGAEAWRRIRRLAYMARCERALGRPERAVMILQQGLEIWEQDRSVPREPEWREQRGSNGRSLHSVLAEVALEFPPEKTPEQRTRATYELLQRFKARTLYERTLGPRMTPEEPPVRIAFRPVTIDALQRDVLGDGELLLDAFSGSFGSYIFAVSRRDLRVVRLPRDEELYPRLRLYHDLLARPPRAEGSGAAADTVGLRLGQFLLGEIADLVRGCRRILFSPDGDMNLLPLAALRVPGPDGPVAVAAREIVFVPSATLLAGLRRSHRADSSRLRVLAVAGLTDEQGKRLPGALREVRRLGSRYEGVDVRVTDEHGAAGVAPEQLSRYDVLHFAAHTRVDDQHPWRSGVLLWPPGSPEGDRYLRAVTIVNLKIPARLAVLSGCESAGGHIFSGEGVQGMATAFLGAGVPAVLATLWRVEDRTTARLMEVFYEALAGGEPAAAALRAAQEAVRRNPRTRHPFYWAGFVLIGDGDVRVALEPRRDWTRSVAALGVVALGVAIVVLRRRRRRRQRPGGAL